MNKKDMFHTEMNYIKTDRLRDSLGKMIDIIPDYFFKVAASSTGKYHPSYALGDGGLLRHTKVAVKIANDLLNTETFGSGYNDVEKDLLKMALIMHDTFKHGKVKEKYVIFDHALVSAQAIKDNAKDFDLTEPELFILTTAIESHMGEWNTNNYSKVVLPKPTMEYQKFVHLCDYLASRKYLEVPFNGNEVSN